MAWEAITRRRELPFWFKGGVSIVLGIIATWASVDWFQEALRGAFAPWRAIWFLAVALGALGYGSLRLWRAKTGSSSNRVRVAKLVVIGGVVGIAITSCPSRPHLPALGTFSVAEHPALGCWELRPSDPVGWYLPGPTRVELDPSAAFGALRLVMDSSAVRWRGPVLKGWWPLDSNKRVYLHWGNGHTGVGLTLALKRDTLFGWTILTTDFGGPLIGRSVIGVRAACPRQWQP